MNSAIQYPKYACQHCGSDSKLVETVIDDEFCWNDKEMKFEANGFRDDFYHTGEERCAECGRDWTGL